MPEYRIYTVDYNGHRIDAKNIECADNKKPSNRRSEL